MQHLPHQNHRLLPWPIESADWPAFRYAQINRAVFHDLIDNWSQATTLPQTVRAGLANTWPLSFEVRRLESSDQRTTKALMTLADGAVIESVLMRYPKRNSVCVSCQVGCAVGCSFCATGRLGFRRNLTPWEIISQVLLFSRQLKVKNERVDSVVFMGMGEPFLNYESVLPAIRLLNDPAGLNLGARHMSISTSGIVPGIRRFLKERLEVNLAISLHAPNDRLRTRLMPINTTYPLKTLMSAASEYVSKARRRLMFEYIMIAGLNDTDDCAEELAALLKHPLYFVNIIPYNLTGIYSPTPAHQVKRFINLLRRQHVSVTQRAEFGQEIMAACGQLAGRSGQSK
ncbi:MAG: 23S rRNA (adenine(2503)-C(2))-methyltransferase RlmN [Patescibacteria group bacterium]|jgi:23S rRNA (adenine2503-C2)-methyltransferase